MLNKKIVFISIVVLSSTACQLNAGQNNFPTAFDCRCKDRGQSSASVLSVNVLGINIPNSSPTPSASTSPEPTPSVTPNHSASPNQMLPVQ